jgi:hypothetical protein
MKVRGFENKRMVIIYELVVPACNSRHTVSLFPRNGHGNAAAELPVPTDNKNLAFICYSADYPPWQQLMEGKIRGCCHAAGIT